MAKAMVDYGLKRKNIPEYYILERIFQKEADHRFLNWMV